MNGTKKIANRTRLLAGVLVLGLCAASAWAKEPESLQASIQQGSQIFATDTFGGKGLTCQSCHAGGGKQPGQLGNGSKIPSLTNAAAIFPRYSPRAMKVVTLENQIQACIAGALGGKPLEYGGLKMTDLVSYLTSLSHGKSMEMGGKPK